MLASLSNGKARNLDHLNSNETLFDYMKSLLAFTIKSSAKCINDYMLNKNGISKGAHYWVSYQDVAGKKEFLNDLILNTIIPSFWFKDIELKPGQDAADTKAVIIDIKGGFSLSKLADKIRKYYDNLLQRVAKEHGSMPFYTNSRNKETADKIAEIGQRKQHDVEFDKEGRKISDCEYIEDKSEFIRTCFENLFVFNVMDAQEFATVARSLPFFFKTHRDIALVCVDGLQYFEYKDLMEDNENEDEEEKLPNADRFFDEEVSLSKNIQKKRARNKHRSSKSDPKYFEKELVERSMNLIREMSKTYYYTFIKFEASMFMKKSAEFQDDIINKGLVEKSDFKVANDNMEMRYNGIIDTVDDNLKEKIRGMRYNEIMILRGDRANSLIPKEINQFENQLSNQHLWWFIKLFPKSAQDLRVGEGSYFKYLSLFVLYNKNENNYSIVDSVVRTFAF